MGQRDLTRTYIAIHTQLSASTEEVRDEAPKEAHCIIWMDGFGGQTAVTLKCATCQVKATDG